MGTTNIDLSASTTLNLTLRQGVGGTLTVTLTRGGAALAITGATIKYYAAASTAIIKTVGSGITISNGAGGVFTMAFTAANTSNLIAGVAVEHECKIQLSGEEPAMVFEGQLSLEASLFTSMS